MNECASRRAVFRVLSLCNKARVAFKRSQVKGSAGRGGDEEYEDEIDEHLFFYVCTALLKTCGGGGGHGLWIMLIPVFLARGTTANLYDEESNKYLSRFWRPNPSAAAAAWWGRGTKEGEGHLTMSVAFQKIISPSA